VRFRLLDEVKQGGDKLLFDGSLAAFAELERRARRPPISERIAADNHQTVHALGLDEVLARLAALRADRARAYAPYLEGPAGPPVSSTEGGAR
jgi:hypothetical protein